jgi:hypothetical protein
VSPCARCAGTAFLDTTIVTVGFDFDPVWWQIVTFFSYWYCCAAASLEFGDATATSAVAKTLATTSADANLWVPKTRFHALASWEADPVG